MGTGRLEAFSDGVIAIIITIMVLELKVAARHHDWPACDPLLPGVPELRAQLRLRRDLLEQPSPHAPRRRTGGRRVLWANLHLLFWLSLVPFVTAWMGENHFAPLPTAALRRRAAHGRHRLLRSAAGRSCARGSATPRSPRRSGGTQGQALAAGVRAGHPARVRAQWLSWALYVGVALIWLIPDRSIERRISEET